jgi:hypothetical protein
MALTQVTGPYPIFTDLDGTPLDDGYLYIGLINQDPEQNPIQVFWDANLTIPATQPIRTSNGYAYRNGTPALLYTGGEFSITIRNKREEFVLYSPVGYGFDPAAVSASVVKNDFIGDGVEVDFVLSAAPSTILATNVFINGVYQEKDSYTLSGNVITFSIAPPLNSSIEIMTNETGVINSGNATAISYTASFAGATAQTVQTKLEQYVSVKDFGAVGDNVTDDTIAIQAAINYSAPIGKTLFFPAGVYKITNLTIPQQHGGVEWVGESMTTTDMLKASIYRGSVLVSTASTGDVISCNGGASYDNRGIQIKNIQIKAQTSGFVIYFKRSPDRTMLDYLSIYNSNSLGSGVCFDSCWVGALITSCNIRGEIGTANSGVKVMNDLKAGGFVMDSCSISGWHKGLEFGVWVYEATIKDTGMEANNYGAYIWQGDNNLTLDTCHFEFNRDHAIHVENTAGIRIVKCSFYRNSEFSLGTKAQIYFEGDATSYSYSTHVQNCYDFGISSDTYFLYHANTAYGNGVIDNNSSSALSGATNTKGVFLGGTGQEYWQVTNNLFSVTTPYTNCELAKQFSDGLNATYGIRFAATPFPSANPKTLDDYEEGFWTPVLGGDTGTSGQSYDYQQGYYVKIGKTVYFTFAVKLTNKGSVANEAILSGLPFIIAGQRGAGSAYISDFENLGVNVVDLTLRTEENTTKCYFRHLTAAASSMTYPLANSLFTNTTMIQGGGFYTVP